MKFSFPIFILVICLTIISSQFRAQQSELPIYNQGVEIAPVFSFNNDFNLDDWYIGASGGIEDLGYQWGARLGLQVRPFRKKIQVLDDNLIRQYRERKYFLSLDLDKRLGHIMLFNAHMQFYLGVRTGLLMGNYSGTRNDADNHFVVAPIGGLCFNFNESVFLKVGYNYFSDRLLNVDDGRINLMFVFNLSSQ